MGQKKVLLLEHKKRDIWKIKYVGNRESESNRKEEEY